MARTFPTNESDPHALPRVALPLRPAPRAPHSGYGVLHSLHPAPRAPRPGFTLVELLVVITILAILASMMLFALAGAQENAKQARTQGTIAKLNTIIMQKYESYRTRRVPVDVKKVATYYQTLTNSDKRFIPASFKEMQAQAMARTDALRDLMRLEMPDGFLDITDDPATQWQDIPGGAVITMARPSASIAYQNAYAGHNNNFVSPKCLYLIVTKGSGDPDVLEQFSTSEIAADTDGMKYFVDGWNQPINFLRWAPAYISPLQPDPTTVTQHDPFDPLNTFGARTPTEKTFPLYPLIYSPGPDGVPDVTADSTTGPVHYSKINNDPFDPSVATFIGKPDGNANGIDETIDNITNHDIETR
jgi:prepilin-type N-terminal cleavage/methylation domain-containing protein